MLRVAALLLLVPLGASAQAPALADLAPRPPAGLTDSPFCLALPGQTPGAVRVYFERRLPVADAVGAVGSGVAVRAPRAELDTVYFLDVDVPVGFEARWCERLGARPGVRVATRLGPTVWPAVTAILIGCPVGGPRWTPPLDTVWRREHADPAMR